MEELVSIIMPVYNAELTISTSISSILNQSYANLELIIIDDCSNDKTLQKINEFDDLRIILYTNKENKGVAYSRNRGITNSKGRYIAFCDSDDYWDHQKLKKQVPYLKTYPVVCSNYFMVNELGKILKEIKGPSVFGYSNLMWSNHIPNSSAIFDKEKTNQNVLQKKIGAEDYLMWLELVKPDKMVYRLQEPLMYYRVHPNSLSSNKIRSMFWTWNILRKELGINFISALIFITSYIIVNIKKHFLK